MKSTFIKSIFIFLLLFGPPPEARAANSPIGEFIYKWDGFNWSVPAPTDANISNWGASEALNGFARTQVRIGLSLAADYKKGYFDPVSKSIADLLEAAANSDLDGAKAAAADIRGRVDDFNRMHRLQFATSKLAWAANDPQIVAIGNELINYADRVQKEYDKISTILAEAERTHAIQSANQTLCKPLSNFEDEIDRYEENLRILSSTESIAEPHGSPGNPFASSQSSEEYYKQRMEALSTTNSYKKLIERDLLPLKQAGKARPGLANAEFLDRVSKLNDANSNLAQSYRAQAQLLMSAKVSVLPGRSDVWDSAVTALRASFNAAIDQAGDVASGFYRTSRALLTYATSARGFADLGSAFTPGISEARAFYETTTGKDLISGETLGYGSRALLGVGMILGLGTGPRTILEGVEQTLGKEMLEAGTEKSVLASEAIIEASIHDKNAVSTITEANAKDPELVSHAVEEHPEKMGNYAKAGKEEALREMDLDRARDVASEIKKRNGATMKNYAGNAEYKNIPQQLPDGTWTQKLPEGTYKKYDVVKSSKGIDRGYKRLVIDQVTGKIWYTIDHFVSFIELKPK